MEVVLPELVSCELYEHGFIEPALSALFIEVVTPGSVVFDVGAHLGYYSLLAGTLGARVHAFEPSARTLPLLERNVPASVTVVPMGIWNDDTTLALKDFGLAHSAVNTFVSVRDETLAVPEESVAARVTTIDSYVQECGDVPALIKIDAEGAELLVLEGAAATIRDARPFVTIEVGDTAAERTSRRAVEFALALGYDAYELSDAGLCRHTVRDVYGYGNILFVPSGIDPPPLRSLGDN